MREADPRTKQALQRLIRHPSLAVKTLAADLRVSLATLYSWAAVDGPVPTLAQVRALIWAAAAYDREAAAQLAAEVFGLGEAGFLVTAAPRVKPTTRDVMAEALEASGAMGEVAIWAASATADGQVQPTEADVGERIVTHALRQLAELKEATARCRAPQLAWNLARAE